MNQEEVAKAENSVSADAVRAEKILESVRNVSRLVRRAGHQLNNGIPDHYVRALRVIERENIRPARLAEHLHVTPRAVTDVVDGLVGEGLVQRSPDPHDRRAQIVSITQAGRATVSAAHQQRVRAAEQIFSALNQGEQDRLLELLEKVVGSSSNLT